MQIKRGKYVGLWCGHVKKHGLGSIYVSKAEER